MDVANLAVGQRIILQLDHGMTDPWDETVVAFRCGRELTVVAAPPKCDTPPGGLWLADSDGRPRAIDAQRWQRCYEPRVVGVCPPDATRPLGWVDQDTPVGLRVRIQEDGDDYWMTLVANAGGRVAWRYDDDSPAADPLTLSRTDWNANNLHVIVEAVEPAADDGPVTDAAPVVAAAPVAAPAGPGPAGRPRTVELMVEAIEVQAQARKSFDDEALFELGESIKAGDLLQPVIVNCIGGSRFVLVAGERRLRATRQIGRRTIECRVYDDLPRARVLQIQGVENLHRVDLDPLEEADWAASYQAETGYTARRIAEETGWSEDKIARRLAIARLPEAVRALAGRDRLTVHHLIELTKGELDDAQRVELAELAAGQHLSVETLRAMVAHAIAPSLPGLEPAPAAAAAAEPPAVGDDQWRACPLATLGISQRLLTILAEHHPAITTLGELCDWQSAKGDYWARDIRGLGPAAADQIADACEAYWARRAGDGQGPGRGPSPDDGQGPAPAADGRPPRTASASRVPRRETTGPVDGADQRRSGAADHEPPAAGPDDDGEPAKPVEAVGPVGDTPGDLAAWLDGTLAAWLARVPCSRPLAGQVQLVITGQLESADGYARLARAQVLAKYGDEVAFLPGVLTLDRVPGLVEAVDLAARKAPAQSARKAAAKGKAKGKANGKKGNSKK